MPIVGSFAGASSRAYGLQAGAGVVTAFDSIATSTVSGTSSFIEFSSIPATYQHLQIRGIARDNKVANTNSLMIRLNSDTGSNYSYHAVYGSGTGANVVAQSSVAQGYLGEEFSNNVIANTFGVFIVDILDYADTNKYTTIRCISGTDRNDTGTNVGIYSTNWRNTNAVSTIRLYPSSDSFVTNTTFALYGILG